MLEGAGGGKKGRGRGGLAALASGSLGVHDAICRGTGRRSDTVQEISCQSCSSNMGHLDDQGSTAFPSPPGPRR